MISALDRRLILAARLAILLVACVSAKKYDAPGAAPILIPSQQNKLIVSGYTDNTSIGSELAARGVTTKQILSQKRAGTAMNDLIRQGMKPAVVSVRGLTGRKIS